MSKDEIVFEDLRGGHDDRPITVDLDASSKEDGITRTPAGQAVDEGGEDNDDIQFDELRPANEAGLEDDTQDNASRAGEDDGYSKKVKARIQRSTRAEKAAKGEAAYWKQQATELSQRQYTQDKTGLEEALEQVDASIANTLTQLDAAIEGGKTKDQVRLTDELTDQKAAKERAKFDLDNLSPGGNVQPFDGKVGKPAATDQSLADKWRADQNDWYGANGFERQTRLANRLDREVFADGYDPKTEEYFVELNRRVAEKQPDLYDDAGDERGKGSRRGQSIITPVGGADHRRSRSSSKVELNEEDFETMREFGMDPNDPEVLKEYARNKLESESRETR